MYRSSWGGYGWNGWGNAYPRGYLGAGIGYPYYGGLLYPYWGFGGYTPYGYYPYI